MSVLYLIIQVLKLFIIYYYKYLQGADGSSHAKKSKIKNMLRSSAASFVSKEGIVKAFFVSKAASGISIRSWLLSKQQIYFAPNGPICPQSWQASRTLFKEFGNKSLSKLNNEIQHWLLMVRASLTTANSRKSRGVGVSSDECEARALYYGITRVTVCVAITAMSRSMQRELPLKVTHGHYL